MNGYQKAQVTVSQWLESTIDRIEHFRYVIKNTHDDNEYAVAQQELAECQEQKRLQETLLIALDVAMNGAP